LGALVLYLPFLSDRTAREPRQSLPGRCAIAINERLEIEERVTRGEPARPPRLV